MPKLCLLLPAAPKYNREIDETHRAAGQARVHFPLAEQTRGRFDDMEQAVNGMRERRGGVAPKPGRRLPQGAREYKQGQPRKQTMGDEQAQDVETGFPGRVVQAIVMGMACSATPLLPYPRAFQAAAAGCVRPWSSSARAITR